MQRIIQKTTGIFSKFAAAGASLSMAVLFLIVFVNSVRRYAIGKSFEWGEELPIFITVYGVMFGMAWAYILDRHIRFTMLVGFISESWTRKLFVLKRGRVEASGIINLAKDLRAVTGWDGMIWFGHQYPYQAAMVLGGVMLAFAALLKFLMRLSETPRPESTGG